MLNCELIDGIINTKVTDLGLFTDSINLKYKEEMLAKARNLITNTICDTIFKTIQDRVNRILHKLPLFLSISDILVTLFGRINNIEESVKKGCNVSTSSFSDNNFDKLLDFFDLNLLNRLLINLEFLDSFAGEDYFSVGLLGSSFVVKNNSEKNIIKLNSHNDNDLLFKFENQENLDLEIDNFFDDNLQNNTCTNILNNTKDFKWKNGSMEIIFSQQLVNNVLLKANLLGINVGQNSFMFGQLLRTNCDLDNVCLGDSMPEASELYPNEQLELKILPIEAPTLNITEDLAIFTLSGVGIFFLARDRLGKPIARIPFSTIFELNIGNGKAVLTIPKLEIHDNVDFFNISQKILQESFVESIHNIIINFARKIINSSDFNNILEQKLCEWGILNPNIKLLNNGFIILNVKEIDILINN
ncbi:BPI2 domain-containing protein [Meloidogyne graminicola]|uniref:BPI2 domain-containing protein n=1 Tax=Meloidogyne graminicola TaxID=189291 RepID=A0A8S9ZNI4_9BILA|nr:BPI2 domain-containing protein [Meloidogyne graminicola]